jgi:hypothetical protein
VATTVSVEVSITETSLLKRFQPLLGDFGIDIDGYEDNTSAES